MASTPHRPVFGISVSLVITATLSILLVGQLMSQSMSGSKSTKAPAGNSTQTPPLTPEEKEAQFHYKVALTALKNNDLEIAGTELEKAAKLAPNNVLVQYNLAVVKSKNNKPTEALVNLKKAMEIGLPAAEAAQADDLLVRLTYDAQKSVSARFSWLKGRWVTNFEGFIRFSTKTRYPGFRGDIVCRYQMDVTSILTVSSDPNDADSLEGKLSYHAQGNGNVITNNKYENDACLSAVGPPSQIATNATLKLSKVEPVGGVKPSAEEEERVLVDFRSEGCTGYCNNWEWGGNPNQIFDLDHAFGAIVLFRINESHVGHSGNFVRSDVPLFGPDNVQLVKQN